MWAIGCYDLRLGEEWQERLTLREFSALAERHLESWWRTDFMHARTAQAIAGGSIDSRMIIKRQVEPKEESGGMSWEAMKSVLRVK